MFRCPSCDAAPEPIPGAAGMTVVRHAPGCPLLAAATRARWPLAPAGLPDTPRQVAFANRAGRSRWRGRLYSSAARRRSSAKPLSDSRDSGRPAGNCGRHGGPSSRARVSGAFISASMLVFKAVLPSRFWVGFGGAEPGTPHSWPATLPTMQAPDAMLTSGSSDLHIASAAMSTSAIR